MYIFEHLNSYTYISKDCGNPEEPKKDDEGLNICNNDITTTDFTDVVTSKEDDSVNVILLTEFYILNLLFIIIYQFFR